MGCWSLMVVLVCETPDVGPDRDLVSTRDFWTNLLLPLFTVRQTFPRSLFFESDCALEKT